MKSPWHLGRLCLQISLAVLGLVAVTAGLRAYLYSPQRGLPYHDSFAHGSADEWKAFGGTWELDNGMMRNDSDERGAKLLTGSPYWRNYIVEADVSLLGTGGDAGLIIRTSNEEEGVNAYTGYYAGVRTIDNSLVLGRAEHGWMEAVKRVPDAGGIRPFRWYHLKLLAYDCQVVASVAPPSQPVPTALAITDPDCVQSGRVGLRSYSSGGIWRNVTAHPATHQDLLSMLRDTGKQDETALQGVLSPTVPLEANGQPEPGPEAPDVQTTSIANLQLASRVMPTRATIRGVVVLTAPQLFVEDSTGGVYVPQPKAPVLKVGDEVEVTGEVHPRDFSSALENAAVKVLWARTPMPPLSVTASQASTGKYDATFIEVSGRLVGKERGPGNTLVLGLDEGSESFRAILNPGRSDYLFGKLQLGSTLRLRGICTVDPAYTHNLTPFVLLLRSNEDLDVIAGPPWWTTGHMIAIAVSALVLAFGGVVLYHRVENWRLRAILEERGRLAHEMHDTLAQSFAGIGFQLQAIRNGVPPELQSLHQQLDLASDLVRHSHEEARRSIASLRSEDLESEDVLSALDRCARRMVANGSVKVISKRRGDQRPIPLRTADTLYRIGQEAIANAVRHAQHTLLTICLDYKENSVSLSIEDNGEGFVDTNHQLGFGIRGMRRRAQSIAATIALHSVPGRGTSVVVEAPLPPRMTIVSGLQLFWNYGREHWNNGRPARDTDSHSYR
ncbi:MAG: histidine kinase [Terracidiphilus sp.]